MSKLILCDCGHKKSNHLIAYGFNSNYDIWKGGSGQVSEPCTEKDCHCSQFNECVAYLVSVE